MSAAEHLEQVRSQSQYRTYRGVISILTIFGYLGGALAAIAGVLAIANSQAAAGIGMLITAAIVIFAYVPFFKEASLMLCDLVDSTLDKNSRS